MLENFFYVTKILDLKQLRHASSIFNNIPISNQIFFALSVN